MKVTELKSLIEIVENLPVTQFYHKDGWEVFNLAEDCKLELKRKSNDFVTARFMEGDRVVFSGTIVDAAVKQMLENRIGFIVNQKAKLLVKALSLFPEDADYTTFGSTGGKSFFLHIVYGTESYHLRVSNEMKCDIYREYGLLTTAHSVDGLRTAMEVLENI